MFPFKLGFLENGTSMGYIYIKCGEADYESLSSFPVETLCWITSSRHLYVPAVFRIFQQ